MTNVQLVKAMVYTSVRKSCAEGLVMPLILYIVLMYEVFVYVGALAWDSPTE